MTNPICNRQLATMLKRVLHICPAWIMIPICRLNRLIPGGKLHEIGQNTHAALDVHNLLDRFPSHLQFTTQENALGEAGLRVMGIPSGIPFVCLIVRDSAYLASHLAYDWNYHNYRDADVQKYVLAAEALAERGYYVIRMGAIVHEAISSKDLKVIDYATNGMRSDFMDIYLGAKCAFCISTGTGWDAVPQMFRRPIVYTNMLPLGSLVTFRSVYLSITKRHVWHASQRTLSLQEIFSQGVGFCGYAFEYESKGVDLIENSSEEICEVVLEMADRLAGTWHANSGDAVLQRRFWEIFSASVLAACPSSPLHGEIRAHFGAAFLHNNPQWLR